MTIPGTFQNAAVVTPHDTNPLPQTAMALFVGGAGNIVLVTEGARLAALMAPGSPAPATMTITGVAAGTIIPLNTFRVLATSTTATNILALY